ncbi:MAG TPA: hypothetical protein VFB13_05110 [Reyranella sp.]|jgi:hypothetical protein|nr:hypothetical protein [Reyranella sp.]
MTMGSGIRWSLLVGLVCLAAACGGGAAKKAPGPDGTTDSDASIVPWKDGKSAIAISCYRHGGCRDRAKGMCPDGYAMLKEEDTAITVRCN